jgi:heme-degrading monooxygenase HmoA
MHVVVWEFVVRPEKIREFVAAYKADGHWAQLFGLAAGYKGTELLSSTDHGDRFLTIDRWGSADDFAHFQQHFAEQYRVLDAQFESFTLSEKKLGTFVVDPA